MNAARRAIYRTFRRQGTQVNESVQVSLLMQGAREQGIDIDSLAMELTQMEKLSLVEFVAEENTMVALKFGGFKESLTA